MTGPPVRRAMLWQPVTGRAPWVRTLPIAFLMTVLTVSMLPVAGASPAAHPGAPVSPGHNAVPTSHVPSSGGARASPVAHAPLVTPSTTPQVDLQFYGNTTGFAIPAQNYSGCSVFGGSSYQYNTCYPQAVSPTLVTLANGNVGIGYSMVSNQTGCAGSTSAYERVGFSTSS